MISLFTIWHEVEYIAYLETTQMIILAAGNNINVNMYFIEDKWPLFHKNHFKAHGFVCVQAH